MSFLYCKPNVLIIKDSYEIIVNKRCEGVCYVIAGRKRYYENNSGIMPSVTLVHRFRLPQKALDRAGGYTVCFKRVSDRKNNFPEKLRMITGCAL